MAKTSPAARKVTIPAEFDVVLTFEPQGRWWEARAPFMPEANGQGKTPAAARRSLLACIRDILDICRKEGRAPRVHRVKTVRVRHEAA